MDGDMDAVREVISALDEAFDRHDLDAVMNLCTEDVVFIGSGEGEETVGRDQLGPMFSALAAELEQSEFSWGGWESVEVEILGDVALVYAWGPATLVTANRNTRFRYRLTGVLVRSDGRWLWRMHHGSEPGAW